MDERFSVEQIKKYLPKYLSPETKQKLFEALDQFPESLFRGENFYASQTSLDPCIVYQGDGLFSLFFSNLETREFKTTDGLVLSNTCDIAIENKRLFPVHMVYALMMELAKYEKMLLLRFSKQQIEDHLNELKNQRVTQLFFLPSYADIPEHVVFLDKITSSPNEQVDRANLKERRKFSLSQYGHYLFMVKLSIHFNRLMDGVDRG